MADTNEKPLYTLWKALGKNNYNVPEDYDDFEYTLTLPGEEGSLNRQKLYTSLYNNNYNVPDNYDDFATTLFVPAKANNSTTKSQEPKQNSPVIQKTGVVGGVAGGITPGSYAQEFAAKNQGFGGEHPGRTDLVESLNKVGESLKTAPTTTEEKPQGNVASLGKGVDTKKDKIANEMYIGLQKVDPKTGEAYSEYTGASKANTDVPSELQGKDLYDENGNLITVRQWQSPENERPNLYEASFWKTGDLEYTTALDSHVKKAQELGMQPGKHSGMTIDELKAERKKILDRYANGFTETPESLQDAIDLNNIDYELTAKHLGYKSSEDMMKNHRGEADFELNKGRLNQGDLDFYEKQGSNVYNLGDNPLYVFGWQKFEDFAKENERLGLTMSVEDYINYLMKDPDIESKFYAWTLTRAKKNNRSWASNINEAMDDFRKAISRGENPWEYAPEEKDVMAEFYGGELDRMDAEYEKELEAWQKRYDAWSANKSGLGWSHAPLGSYAAETGDNALGMIHTAQNLSKDARSVIDEAMKTGRGFSLSGEVGASVRGFRDSALDWRTWTFGIADLEDSKNMYNVAKKWKDGGQLNKAEQMLLDQMVLKAASDAFFNDYLSTGYEAGKTTGYALEFIAEMLTGAGAATDVAVRAMGSGLKKLGKKKVVQLLERIGMKGIVDGTLKKLGRATAKFGENKVGKVISKAIDKGTKLADEVVSVSNKGIGQTLGPGIAKVGAQTFENATGQAKGQFNPNTGRMEATSDSFADGMDFFAATKKAVKSEFGQNASEFLGDALLEPGIKWVNKFYRGAADKAFKKFGMKEAREFLDSLKGNDWYRFVQDFRKQVHYNGSFGEYCEEVANNIYDAAFVGDQNFNSPDDPNSVFNFKKNFRTYVSCKYMSLAFGAANVASYRTPKYRANQDVKYADQIAKRAFVGEDWGSISSIIRDGSDEQVEQLMVDIAQSKKYNARQRQAAINYAGAVYAQKGIEAGDSKVERSVGEQEARDAYGRGYNMANLENISETSGVYNQLRAQMEQEYGSELMQRMDNEPGLVYDWVRAGAVSGEDAQKVLNYLNAKMAYDGAMDRLNDDDAAAKAAAEAHVDETIHTEENGGDGQIHPVALKGREGDFFVVSGNVATDNEGNVDVNASDTDIVVVDSEGKRIMTHAKDIAQVGDAIDPEAAKADAVAQIEGATQEVINEEESGENGEVLEDETQVESTTPEATTTGTDATQAPLAVPEYNQDDLVTVEVDGQQIDGIISNGLDSDGNITIHFDKPINGRQNWQMTPEQLNQVAVSYTSRDGVKIDRSVGETPQPQQQQAPGAPVQEQAPVSGESEEPLQQPAANGELDVQTGETPQTPNAPVAETPQQAPAQPSLPIGEDGNADFSNATPQEAHDYIYNDPELDEDEANQAVQNKLKGAQNRLDQAQAALDQAQAIPAPNMEDYGEDTAGYKRAKRERNEAIAQAQAAVDAAQRDVDLWNGVQAQHMMSRAAANAAANREENPAAPAQTQPAAEPTEGTQEASAPQSEENGPVASTTPSSEENAPIEGATTADERIEQAIKERIKQRAQELANACGIPVTVAESLDDLTVYHRQEVEAQHEAGQYVNGFYDPRTNEIVLYLPDIMMNGGYHRLDITYLHEGAAHGGLRALFQNGKDGIKTFNDLCDEVWNSMSDAAKLSRINYNRRNAGRKDLLKASDIKDIDDKTTLKERRDAADEYMAQVAEGGVDQTTRDKIIVAVRKALRKLLRKVKNLRLSDREIVDLLAQSRRNLEEMDKVEANQEAVARLTAQAQSGNRDRGGIALSANANNQEVSKAVDAAINGAVESRDGKAEPLHFSVSAMAEGAGFEAMENDGKGNVAMRIGDKLFTGETPITVDDIKNAKNAPINYIMEDARALKTVTEEQIEKIYNDYASMLNRMLEKGLKKNGGFMNLAGQWRWIAETAFRTVHDNSDDQYGQSIDISTICKKNEAVINAISKKQVRQGFGVTPNQILHLYENTHAEGYQVPCPVCYVFSHYLTNGRHATIMINGWRKYGDRMADPSTLSEAEQKKRVKWWTNEYNKAVAWNKAHEKEISQAKSDIQHIEDDINKLSRKILGGRMSAEEEAQARKKVEALDKRYRAAVNLIAQSSLDKWIKCFAINVKKDSSKNTLREDSWREIPDEMALDFDMTAESLRYNPGVQRLRSSDGSSGGKYIHQASNNEVGEVLSMLGLSDSSRDAVNPWLEASRAKTEKERNTWLKKARDRFKNAVKYMSMQSLRGGQRMWSWSDNIESLAPDVYMNLMQLQLLSGTLQSYSKQLEGIDLVARMGGYVNGSLMGAGKGYRELTEDEVERTDDGLFVKDGDFVFTTDDGETVTMKAPVYEMDGKYYTLEFDDVVGVSAFGKEDENGNHLKGLFELNYTLDKAGNILVGMNDMHNLIAMSDPRVFFIIPYHKSGLSAHMLMSMYNLIGVEFIERYAQNYEGLQEDTFIGQDEEVLEPLVELWESHKNEEDFACGIEGGIPSDSGKLSDQQKEYRALRNAIFTDKNLENDPARLAKIKADVFLRQVYDAVTNRSATRMMQTKDTQSIYPYEYWDESSTYDNADVNGARYVEYCRRMGVRPKFSGMTQNGKVNDHGNFVDAPGYWKTLIDRRMYDTNGNYQGLDAVDTEGFNVDLVDPEVTATKFPVTRVADAAGTERIVDRTEREENEMFGEPLSVNYDMTGDQAVKEFNQAVKEAEDSGVMFSTSESTDGEVIPQSIIDELGDKLYLTDPIEIADPNNLNDEDKKIFEIFKNKKEKWRRKVADWALSKLPKSTKTSFGEVEYRNAKIRGALSHGFGNLKMLTLPHLDKMFKDGILFDQREEDGFTYYNVAHRLRYQGEDYVARLVAREDKMGNLFYDHEFTEIKKIGAPASGREGHLATSPHQSPAKILENIIASKLLREKSSETTENGENMLMSTSPTFYSNAERAVENIKQNKATAEQWKAMLTKAGGIKAGEDKWMGLSTWLDENKGKSLTKDEVMQFVKDNGIQMEETHYKEGLSESQQAELDKLQQEFDEIANTPEEVYKQASKRFADYVGEMEKKYGEDYLDKMTYSEKRIYSRFAREQEEADPVSNDVNEIALREMISRYGDDFDLAFTVVDGKLIPQADPFDEEDFSGYTNYFLGEGDNTINSTRLSYTTGGLENNREIAFVIPDVEPYQESDTIHFGPENEGKAVMWVRFGETTDADGKRVLVIDEIQSNRHQDAREKGYKKYLTTQDLVIEDLSSRWAVGIKGANGNSLGTEFYPKSQFSRQDAAQDFLKAKQPYRGDIPSAPFEKNWQEVAMKRMLRLAAEEGFDKVAWTTGEQQADRYNLGGKVGWIQRGNDYGENPEQIFIEMNGSVRDVEVDENGNVVDASHALNAAIGKPLSEVIGKELADKVLSSKPGINGRLSGGDLRIGGEGMRGFYDNILPRFMDKYGKRWGVKTGTVELPNVEEAGRTMHSVDVTPEMKESVMQGQPLFSVSDVNEAMQEAEVDGGLRFSVREKPEPKKTIPVYKLMRLGDDGKLYPLFIDGTESIELGVWYDADSPNMDMLVDLPIGVHLIDTDNGTSMTMEEYVKQNNIKLKKGQKYPPKEVIKSTPNGQRWVYIEPTERGQRRFGGESRRYWNLGINGSGSVSTFSMRPGWHAGSLPTMRQIGKSRVKGGPNTFRDDRFVWVEGLISADIDYNEEAQRNPDNDIPTHIPTDGFYLKATNANAKASQADRVGWYISGAFMPVKIMSDSEARQVIDKWNADPKHADLQVEYDFPRESGKVFNAETMQLEDETETRFSTSEAVATLKDDERVYNDLLGKVFSGVSNGTRRGIVETAMRDMGNDFGAATESWLMGLADNGKFAQVPEEDWRKVKDALSNTLRDYGVDGAMTDNEARYVLWKAGQIEDGVFSMAEDIVMQDRLLNGDSAPQYTGSSDVRFSTSESEENDLRFSVTPRDRAIARDQYERWMKNWRIQFTEAFQDSMIGLKKLMQAIMGDEYGYIEDIPMYENPYIAENLMSPTTAAEQHVFDHDYMQPILKEIANLCKGKRREREQAREDLTNYLMAKHGLERNQVLADRDAQETAQAGGDYQEAYQENRERDYSGLTALTGEDDVHAAEAKAQQMVAAYEAQHDTTELWNKINAATKKTLEKQYKSGMLSYAEYQRISGMFDYYVPLRGWEETTSDQVYGYLTSKAGPFLGGSIAKRAGGRTSKAEDPIANIAQMGDDSIRTGNRNLMKQMFLNFVQNHPSDLVSVSDLWLKYDDVTDEWVPVFANIKPKDSADVVEQKIQDFEQQMQELAEQEPDKYKHGRETANIPYRVVPGMEKEHQVLVKRNGQTWVLTINGNPRAAQALNGLTNPDVSTGTWADYIFKTEDAVNRALSAMMTTYSPNFIVSNFARDTAYVNTMVWAKENKNYALAFHANHAKLNPAYMRFLLGRWENGTLDESKPYQKYFKEFMLNGGETGYAMAQDLDDYKKKINKELGIPNGNYAVTRAVRRVVSAATPEAAKKAGRILADQYELLGRAIENSARFAAFVTSREMGRDVKRSAYDAKEISVNFNKKGSGGKMFLRPGQTFVGNVASLVAALTRAFYTFFNAGVQGMTNVGRNLKRHPYKSSAGIASLLTMGIMQPMLAAMMGAGDGDDDDKNAYYNLPPYVRRSNLCIYLPGWIAEKTKNTTVDKYMQGTWLCIPLPVEYRAIFGFGELMYSAISGNERYPDKWELAKETTAQFSQLLPVDFLEGGGGFSAFIPTSLKPMWEIHNNVGWSGAPIYKDNEWNKDDPEYTKAFSNTSEWLVDFTEWLNAKTLRNPEDEVGFLNWNPAKIEYFVKGYTGGVYSSIMEIMRAAQTAFGDREFEWRNVPLANRILKQSDERMESRNLMNEYYNLKEEYDKTKKDIDKYQKADNTDYFDYAEKLSFLNYSDRYKRYLIMDEYMDELNGLSKDLKDAKELGLPEETIAEAERKYMAKLHQMVDDIHKFEDTGNPPSYIPILKRVDKSRDPKLIYSKHRLAEDIINDNLLKSAIKRAKKEGNIGMQKALEGVNRNISDIKKELGYEGANVDEIMDSIRKMRDGALRSFGIIGGEEEAPEPEEQWTEEPEEDFGDEVEEPEMIEEPIEEPYPDDEDDEEDYI